MADTVGVDEEYHVVLEAYDAWDRTGDLDRFLPVPLLTSASIPFEPMVLVRAGGLCCTACAVLCCAVLCCAVLCCAWWGALCGG